MWKWKSLSRVWLCDPMDCIVHGILHATILEWVAFPFSRNFPNPGIELRSPALQADSLPTELSEEPLDSQGYGFSSSHVWMWELDHKEVWTPKNWCFWTVVLGLLRVPWTARRWNQSILKEISPEYSLEGLLLKLKSSNTWPPDVKSQLIRKLLDAGKDWRQEEKGTTEDEMVG